MLETRLEAAASRKKSFGYALLQKYGSEWKMVEAGSRYLRDVQTRYAMVELEALAIHYGVKQCQMHLSELQHFYVITDHQPLKTILNGKDLFEIDNHKLMKIKQELLSKYIFTVDDRKGANHGVPNALIRNPLNDPEKDGNFKMDFGRIAAINGEIGIQDLNIRWLKNEGMKEDKYKAIHDAVVSGFLQFRTKYGSWTKSLTNQYVRDVRPHRNQLSTEGKFVKLEHRIFIPEQCRRLILRELHKGHQGITRTLQNARQSVYWKDLTRDIEGMRNGCKECQQLRSSNQKEPLEADELPERPFDVVSADLFYTGGRVFMIFSDRLSGFPLIETWTKDPRTGLVI